MQAVKLSGLFDVAANQAKDSSATYSALLLTLRKSVLKPLHDCGSRVIILRSIGVHSESEGEQVG